MLQMLVDDLNSMSDQELIKSYEDNGMVVTNYNPSQKGHIYFYDDNCNGVISGNVRCSDTCSLINDESLSYYNFEEGVA